MVLEAIRKSQDAYEFGWKGDPSNPDSYNIYCSLTPNTASMQLVENNISTTTMYESTGAGKSFYRVTQTAIQAILGASVSFLTDVIYFTITYTKGVMESTKTLADIIAVPPVGIGSRLMKDDPTINRHPYVFSDNDQRWIKQAGSGHGALITDGAVYYKTNEIQEMTLDSSGSVLVLKAYLADATTAGSYAKLVTYTYGNPSFPTKPTKIVVSDSTV